MPTHMQQVFRSDVMYLNDTNVMLTHIAQGNDDQTEIDMEKEDEDDDLLYLQ